MSEKKHNVRRLSGRDREILEHVVRYRLTTKETLHRLFFNENEPNAAIKVANRLCDEGWLRKFSLLYPRQYLVAGTRTVQSFGLPTARSLPLGPQALPTEYAILHYSAAAENVERLKRREVSARFDWYRDEWAATAHCVRTTDTADVLELVRVDLGGPADHVARKCVADFATRNQSPVFQHAIENALFRLVVITATADKAAATQLSLHGHLWPDGISFHLAVVPELLPLLPGGCDAT